MDVPTWNDAFISLKRAYGVNKPAHAIFHEVFSAEQREDEPSDIFIDNARALFALLPSKPVLHVQHQLDMICGFLNSRIPKRVSRNNISNFDELREIIRAIEDRRGLQRYQRKSASA